MKIHNVKRDIIRMVSGEVHVTDPIAGVERASEVRRDLHEIIARVDPVLRDTVPYFAAYAYDRLDSKVAGSPIIVMVHKIASIKSMTVQIEAPEDASFPIVPE